LEEILPSLIAALNWAYLSSPNSKIGANPIEAERYFVDKSNELFLRLRKIKNRG
jgi:hypothetical protein